MVAFKSIALLTLSNAVMTFAWYAHLQDLKDKPWMIAMSFVKEIITWNHLGAAVGVAGAVLFMFRKYPSW